MIAPVLLLKFADDSNANASSLAKVFQYMRNARVIAVGEPSVKELADCRESDDPLKLRARWLAPLPEDGLPKDTLPVSEAFPESWPHTESESNRKISKRFNRPPVP